MTLRSLNRRLGALLSLAALGAFASGAGLDAPSIVPAALLLAIALFVDLPERLRLRAEIAWRILATLLAVRAAYHAFFVPEDVVLPMVDLLLLLVLAEIFRARDATGEARLYALTFALLIASAAYRPGIAFGVAFVVYIAVLTLALIVGQLARRSRARSLPEPRLPRGFMRQSAAASSIVLLVSLVVFLAFPRVSRGWATRGGPEVRNVMGFSERVSLLDHGARLYANPEVVLRVEFPQSGSPPPGPLYFRGRSYDYFDGWSWSRSAFLPGGLIERGRWPEARTEQLIYQRTLAATNVLFGLSPLLHVEARSRILPYRESGGDYVYSGRAEPVYRAVSAGAAPAPDSLRLASGPTPRVIHAFRRLPSLSRRVQSLADSLVAGHANDYDRAVAVRDWLRGSFSYTLDLPASAREASLEHFLFERRAGHCEYFSTAMAVLLRAAGIPARNVNGFLGGEWNEFGGYLTVTQNQAHSWVEVWFPEYGWVLFDPTPAGAAAADATARNWWAPFRFVLDGLEHRWGKWVLDFDLDAQAELARGATDALNPRALPDPRAPDFPWGPLLIGTGAVLLAAGLWRARNAGDGRRPGARAVARSYLRLRRAYARRGWDGGHLPALTFGGWLEQQGAPGAPDVMAVARLYSEVRFGGRPCGAGERNELRRRTRSALSALRRSPRR